MGSQSQKTGKAISPFLSDRVTILDTIITEKVIYFQACKNLSNFQGGYIYKYKEKFVILQAIGII